MQRRGRERRPDDAGAVFARRLPVDVVDEVPAEQDVVAVAELAGLCDRERPRGGDHAGRDQGVGLLREQAPQLRSQVVGVALVHHRLRRHPGERRGRVEALAESLAVGGVVLHDHDGRIAARLHERRERVRQLVEVRGDAYDLGVAPLRDLGGPGVAHEERRPELVRLLDLGQHDRRVPAGQDHRAVILRDRLDHGPGADVGVGLVVVGHELDAEAVDAAVAVDPFGPHLRGLEDVSARDDVARLGERQDHADPRRAGRSGARGRRAQERPASECRRGQRRSERLAPRQLFVHSIPLDAIRSGVLGPHPPREDRGVGRRRISPPRSVREFFCKLLKVIDFRVDNACGLDDGAGA